jgi:hypothetical protein
MHRGRRAWHGLRRRIGCSRSWTAAFRGLTMVLPDVLGKVPGRLGMVVRALPTRSLTACNRQPSDSELVHDHIRLRQHEIAAVTWISVRIGARHVEHVGTAEGGETVGGSSCSD